MNLKEWNKSIEYAQESPPKNLLRQYHAVFPTISAMGFGDNAPPLPPLCPAANVGVTCRQPTTIPARRLSPGSYATYLRQRERLRRKPI